MNWKAFSEQKHITSHAMTQSYTPLSRPFAVATPQLSFEMDPIVQFTRILFGFAWLDITDCSSATAVSSAQARHAPFEVNWQQLQAVPAKQRGSLKQHNTFGLFNYLLSGSIWYSWSPKLSCQGLIPTSQTYQDGPATCQGCFRVEPSSRP